VKCLAQSTDADVTVRGLGKTAFPRRRVGIRYRRLRCAKYLGREQALRPRRPARRL